METRGTVMGMVVDKEGCGSREGGTRLGEKLFVVSDE